MASPKGGGGMTKQGPIMFKFVALEIVQARCHHGGAICSPAPERGSMLQVYVFVCDLVFLLFESSGNS